jgi:hypothetical protein
MVNSRTAKTEFRVTVSFQDKKKTEHKAGTITDVWAKVLANGATPHTHRGV